MTLEQKQQSEQTHQQISKSQTPPVQVDDKTKKRTETQQAMRPLLNTSVMVQRRTISPLFQAISLQREEEQYLGTEQQSLQRKIDGLGELPKGAVQEAIQRHLEAKAPAIQVKQPKTPADWVTIMRQKAAEVDGKRMGEREVMHLQTLQCQVADHLNQGYRRDRQTSEARNAEYGGMLASLHDHPRSQQVSNAVLGMVPKSDQPKLQRALDEALQRKQDLVAQDQVALQVHALQRKQAELKEKENKPIAERIQARKGSGSPLLPHIQKHLEQGLNYDLSKVRIHEDAEADKMAKSVNAVAFTSGTDIFFQSGKYKPNTKEGLELLAHEVTHAVQQSKGQVAKGIDPDAGLEQEAQAMGKQLSQVMPNPKSIMPPVPHKTGPHAPDVYSKEAAVQRSQAGAAQYFSLKPLYDLQPKSVQRMATGDVTVQRGLWSWLKDKGQQALAKGLTIVPGYDILCKVFGKDLVTGDKIEDGAESILKTLGDWVPGPLKDIIKALKETNVVGKAWDWFKGQLTELNFSGLISDIGDALSSASLSKAKEAVNSRITGLKNLILGSAKHIAEIALTAITAGLGPVGEQIMAKLKGAGDVIVQVLKDPAQFAKNLLEAVKGGFQKFSDNASTHLEQGIGSWLSGASGITFPAKFDLQGVFMTALSVMGLTYQFFRGKLVRALGPSGENKVSKAEQTVEALKTMKTGFHNAKEMKDNQKNVGGEVKTGIKNEVTKSLVVAGIAKVASMLIPGGGFVQAIMSAFRSVQFLIDQGKQIMGVVMGAMNSVGAIAAGNIGGAIGYIDQTLGRSIPVTLGFLSKVLGLGNIGGKIKNVINRMRAKLDAVMDRMVARVKALVERLTGRGKVRETKQESVDQKDNNQSLEIKQKAGVALTQALPKEFRQPHQVRNVMQSVFAKYKREGLKALRIEMTDKNKALFALSAKASPFKKVAYTKATIAFTAEDLGALIRRVTLYATVDGRKIGPFISTGDGTHAEQNFINFMNENWESIASQSGNPKIDIQLTSSMCGIDSEDDKCRDCAGNIQRWAKSKGIHINIDILGIYKGRNNKSSMQALREIINNPNSGITLRTWEESSAIQQLTSSLGDAFTPEMKQRISSKLRNAKKALEELSGEELK